MSIRKYPWRPGYATSDLREDGKAVDVLHDFYIPALQRATHYDRVAGYFTSSSLAAASQGFSQFVENGGHARFVVGMALQPDDAAAILHGDEQRAQKAMLDELDSPGQWPDTLRCGVELLSWMVANGYLEIRVGLRVNAKDGTPQDPEFSQDGYLHEKWAILGDEYDELFISGSLNESRTALSINAENITLMRSWDDWNRPIFEQKKRNFEALWKGTHPYIKTLSLPQAVKARLVTIAKNTKNLYEIDATPAPPEPEVHDVEAPVPEPADQLRFAMLRLAPLLPGGERVALETTPIVPWPHQRFVARRLLETFPRNQMLCDEVGLGKTIEAGLAFRSLWLTGGARSIRVFAPASLTSQWLVEMAEKFYMPFARRLNQKGDWERIDMSSGVAEKGPGEMFGSALEIISTGLIINRRGGRLLSSFPDTDVVLVDEAHKARRQAPDNHAAQPTFNKLYQELSGTLYSRSRTLMLATATPMQLNRIEAFDLLKLMPVAGAVQFSEDLCEIFYRIREKLLDQNTLPDYELKWLARYLHDARFSAPEQWQFVNEHVLSLFGKAGLSDFVNSGMKPMNWAEVQPALSQLAPLGRSMLRHTRSLLRTYQREGLLNATLAWRKVTPRIIPLSGIERTVYDQLQEYCADLAEHIAANMEEGRQRAAIGFYLSFLRLRYASSFHALSCSLERRLIKIQQTLDHKAQLFSGLPEDREDLEELQDDEVEGLVLKNRTESDLTWEYEAVRALLATLSQLPAIPRKTHQLLQDIDQRRLDGGDRVRQLVLFTRYADTMEYLHSKLRQLLPGCPIGTFSGSGGTLRHPGEFKPETLDRTTIKQYFVAGSIDILLCTDAAAEGLNLQSANLLINFDLPWNPMMLEQRIGRIDRIGQHHQQINVFNYLYQDSVEEVVYSRLVKRFKEALNVSGELQFSLLPIQPEDFEDFAKSKGEEGKIDEDELIRRAERHAAAIKERQRLTEFPAEEQKAAYEQLEREEESKRTPATLDDIWQVLTQSNHLKALGCRIESFPHGDALCLADGLGAPPGGRLLTTSRELFERGLDPDDTRKLHFATYGDPVFDRLLDRMVRSLDGVQQAWEKRTPLAAIHAGEHVCSSVEDALTVGPIENTEFELTERPVRPKPTNDDRVGRHQKAMVDAATSSLAEKKLRAQDDTVKNQIAEIDRFCGDVYRRQDQKVRLRFHPENRHGLLAVKGRLLWPIDYQGDGLYLEADPLFLGAAREIIFRQLGSSKKGQRSASDIAKRLIAKKRPNS